ncbi:LOW QUALITY PROTEIN: hypothetical protein PHMEG_00014354 [Phytophthora megakarya]|uniref:Uncharacterized protein n=1 Tax=Phytophthora megakarya TaxID=4795 RepID=A0A225W630_9STRA|nr:LOW QUALITY PROTEIN: hypothetical protein PHMEG_00014354 [Phytophthora megakarya]
MEQRRVTGKSTSGNTTTEASRPRDFHSQMRRFFKGLHHPVARGAQNSNDSLCERKEPFSFSTYRAVANAMLQSDRKQYVFGHAFLLTSWNLMCRAKPTESIRRGHLSWRENAMTVTFAHMKNDQDGSRPRDPRHLYANPDYGRSMPNAWFGIFLLYWGFHRTVKPPRRKSVHAIPESTERRQRKRSVRIRHEKDQQLTFVAVRRQVRRQHLPIFEPDGLFEECKTSRYVADIPFDSPNFVILPPFFTTQNYEKLELQQRIKSAVDSVFPGAPPNLRWICQFGLGSLLYHKVFLHTTLPPTQLLSATPLFNSRNEAQFESGYAGISTVEISKRTTTLLLLVSLHTST